MTVDRGSVCALTDEMKYKTGVACDPAHLGACIVRAVLD